MAGQIDARRPQTSPPEFKFDLTSKRCAPDILPIKYESIPVDVPHLIAKIRPHRVAAVDQRGTVLHGNATFVGIPAPQ